MIKWLKKVFVPHEENDHHPHFWRDASVAIILITILLVEAAVFFQSRFAANIDSYLASVVPGVLTALTNVERSTNRATPLAENALLAEAARLKAEDMAAKGYFSHTTPEGYSSWYWLNKVGYQYAHAGENLAVNFTDSKDVVDAWMKSPTHRANIVKQIYTEIGIGMAEGMYQGRPAIFVAQFFGTPSIIAKAQVSAPKKISTSTAATRVATTTTAITTTTTTTQPIVAGIEIDQSDENKAPAVSNTNVAAASTITPGFFNILVTSPRHVGLYVLLTLLALVIFALCIALAKKAHLHHPRIVAMAVALAVIIVGLMVLNKQVFQEPLIVGEEQAGDEYMFSKEYFYNEQLTEQVKSRWSFLTGFFNGKGNEAATTFGIDNILTTQEKGETILLPIEFKRQEHALTCEIASLRMVLNYLGVDVTEEELLTGLQFSTYDSRSADNVWGDPQQGFVGDVDGSIFFGTGYGVYNEPIHRLALNYRDAEIIVDPDLKKVLEHVGEGRPVITWGLLSDRYTTYWFSYEGNGIKAFPGEHARIVIGYKGTLENPSHIVLMDPLYGKVTMETKKFLREWQKLDYMSVVVS